MTAAIELVPFITPDGDPWVIFCDGHVDKGVFAARLAREYPEDVADLTHDEIAAEVVHGYLRNTGEEREYIELHVFCGADDDGAFAVTAWCHDPATGAAARNGGQA